MLQNRLFNLRQLLLIISDVFFVYLSGILAVMISTNFEDISPLYHTYSSYAFLNIILTVSILAVFGSYNSIWRHASGEEFLRISAAVLTTTSIFYLGTKINDIEFPISFTIIFATLILTFTASTRLSYRFVRLMKNSIFYKQNKMIIKKILVVGAGNAGAQVIKEMQLNPEMKKKPVVMVDDNPLKMNLNINGVKVEGTTADIPTVAEAYGIDEIIIALPSAAHEEKKRIAQICEQTKISTTMVPGLSDLIEGRVAVGTSKEVDVLDLLKRDEIRLECRHNESYIKDKVVLITGGGGSIGSELCRQVLAFCPKQLIIFDIYENNAYDIQNELLQKYAQCKIKTLIGSVRDEKRLRQVFEAYRPEIVFHAAAHKHVPLMEDSPAEAIKNNVFGTLRLAETAHQFKVEKFVLISTDKAVNPTNIMGASKRLAEMIIQNMNQKSNTEFVAVRFGNVLGSNGSVIPLFRKQIAEGGPVKVTHPEIIRYFMTIPEAVQLVIQAGTMAKGGEIFILDMGKPVKILTLAEDLIRLSGYVPHEDIKIIYTGLRPGEKLYEELLLAEEGIRKTSNNKIYVAQPTEIESQRLTEHLTMLSHLLESSESSKVIEMMANIVPTYTPQNNGGKNSNGRSESVNSTSI